MYKRGMCKTGCTCSSIYSKTMLKTPSDSWLIYIINSQHDLCDICKKESCFQNGTSYLISIKDKH